MDIRIATPADDLLIIDHHIKIWESYETPAEDFRPDVREAIAEFLENGRTQTALTSFIADVDGNAAGSLSCYVGFPVFPAVIRSEKRLPGYIWSVFVDDAFRGRGIAKALVKTAVEHLRGAGCTLVILHASDAGEPVYRSVGFEMAREMRLKFEA
ncbi:GNAT family N-acetyltransferase [Ciceribacter sp. L1K23]|uniref:GNAT family N-acetyltransferase n=1 Tax=Ciceribacter sp. L1K23 TaxID=2820276 RepID=UPI001B82BB4E|nr:GNAT family N-acetyltransferase [Ciceribacter sp. L1K23]MBR0555611.1 GNAT family N-acetyltransferase [Ciceribacter sp. L1K23]